MASGLGGLRVLLGVSGGIAAYKAAELVRRLREAGAEVRVVMTAGAERFVTALSFQALSGHPVRSSLWDASAEAAMDHIALARWAERILIAPASASLLARLACGLADDLLSTLCLASRAPLAVAPAMNQAMWAHPATQSNLARLRERGVAVLGPGEGAQACGETGPGRMLEPLEILAVLERLHASGPLRGRRIVVSAGPTFEDIDPVRFIGNRSSGRMGFALAQAARELGADVVLVSGPVSLDTPAGVERIDVRSALQMQQAVEAALPGCDAYIGAAAVSDYRPLAVSAHKLKKGTATMRLELTANPDLIAALAARPSRPYLVGFAAETERLVEHARAKREAKGLDLIVANDVSTPGLGFESDRNAVVLISADGEETLGPDSKLALARAIMQRIGARLPAPRGSAR